MLTLNRTHILYCCFHCRLWSRKFRLGKKTDQEKLFLQWKGNMPRLFSALTHCKSIEWFSMWLGTLVVNGLKQSILMSRLFCMVFLRNKLLNLHEIDINNVFNNFSRERERCSIFSTRSTMSKSDIFRITVKILTTPE